MAFNIVGIGEVLWDLLPDGRQLGGAPANFAYHARSLGANARPVSRIGDDENGRGILQKLGDIGLPTDGIEIDQRAPTGTVGVTLSNGQPTYTIHEGVAWDFLDGRNATSIIESAHAICFGTLAQRSEISRTTIRRLVAATPAAALRILDINLRQEYFSRALLEESLALANVFKLNDSELRYFASEFILHGDERAQLQQISERFAVPTIALTRGERGSLLYRNGEFDELHGTQINVVDTIGAGDAFTAAMTIGLLANWPLSKINQSANKVAAFVCSCSGATPPLPQAIREMFSPAFTRPVSTNS